MKTTERSFTDLCGEQHSVCPYLLKVKGCRALFDLLKSMKIWKNDTVRISHAVSSRANWNEDISSTQNT